MGRATESGAGRGGERSTGGRVMASLPGTPPGSSRGRARPGRDLQMGGRKYLLFQETVFIASFTGSARKQGLSRSVDLADPCALTKYIRLDISDDQVVIPVLL